MNKIKKNKVKKSYEKDIQKAIIQLLRLQRFVIFKHNSTQFGVRNGERFAFRSESSRGVSDLIACSPKGRFWAIEVKRKGGKPTDEQLAFIANINSAGGKAFIAYSLDDVMVALENKNNNNNDKTPKPTIQVSPLRKREKKTVNKASNSIR